MGVCPLSPRRSLQALQVSHLAGRTWLRPLRGLQVTAIDSIGIVDSHKCRPVHLADQIHDSRNVTALDHRRDHLYLAGQSLSGYLCDPVASFALAALLRLAHEHACCILTLDHHKKRGAQPDVIDDIYGSTGKAAVIDTAWGLYKERGREGAMLEVPGRDIEPRELAIEFDGSSRGWQRMEGGEQDVRTEAEQEVYELLQEMGEADAGTLANGLSKDRSNACRPRATCSQGRYQPSRAAGRE